MGGLRAIQESDESQKVNCLSPLPLPPPPHELPGVGFVVLVVFERRSGFRAVQELTTVSLQLGFSGPPEGNPICPNLIEIKEERVEGLAGFEPATCGLGNRGSPQIRLAGPEIRVLFLLSTKPTASSLLPGGE